MKEYIPDFYIEMFQTSKRMATNQIFKDERLNKVANDFIDAQTVFAKMMAKNTGQDLKKVEKDMDRDYFMSSDEAKKYGIIDKVLN